MFSGGQPVTAAEQRQLLQIGEQGDQLAEDASANNRQLYQANDALTDASQEQQRVDNRHESAINQQKSAENGQEDWGRSIEDLQRQAQEIYRRYKSTSDEAEFKKGLFRLKVEFQKELAWLQKYCQDKNAPLEILRALHAIRMLFDAAFTGLPSPKASPELGIKIYYEPTERADDSWVSIAASADSMFDSYIAMADRIEDMEDDTSLEERQARTDAEEADLSVQVAAATQRYDAAKAEAQRLRDEATRLDAEQRHLAAEDRRIRA